MNVMEVDFSANIELKSIFKKELDFNMDGFVSLREIKTFFKRVTKSTFSPIDYLISKQVVSLLSKLYSCFATLLSHAYYYDSIYRFK